MMRKDKICIGLVISIPVFVTMVFFIVLDPLLGWVGDILSVCIGVLTCIFLIPLFLLGKENEHNTKQGLSQ